MHGQKKIDVDLKKSVLFFFCCYDGWQVISPIIIITNGRIGRQADKEEQEINTILTLADVTPACLIRTVVVSSLLFRHTLLVSVGQVYSR